MIFVVAGMHSAGFDRLVRFSDALAPKWQDNCVMQVGSSQYLPRNASWFRFCQKSDFDRHLREASYVISQAGYTLVEAVIARKRVVAVPRRRENGEAIDNHQVDFANWLQSRGLVVVAETELEIAEAIQVLRERSSQVAESAYAEVLSRRNQLREFITHGLESFTTHPDPQTRKRAWNEFKKSTQDSPCNVSKPASPEPSVSTLDISVVICTKNSENTLGRTIESVLANTPGQIIIVDGLSVDSTRRIAADLGLEVVSDRGLGLGEARNLGVSRTDTRFVAFVDSDVFLPPGVLRTMLGELVTSGYAGIHAQLLSSKNETYWQSAENDHFKEFFNVQGPRKDIATIACVFRREVLATNPFDPFFVGAAEDGDLFLRLNEQGYRLGISSAVAYHLHRATLAEFVAHKIWYGRGTARLAFRHHSLTIALSPLALSVYATLLQLGRGSARMLPYWVFRAIGIYAGMLLEFAELTIGRGGFGEKMLESSERWR